MTKKEITMDFLYCKISNPQKLIYILSGTTILSSLAAWIFYLKSYHLETTLQNMIQSERHLAYNNIVPTYIKSVWENQNFRNKVTLGSFQLILGCAQSGKSSHLTGLYEKYEILNEKMLQLKMRPLIDLQILPLPNYLEDHISRNESYKNSTYIFIDDLNLWNDKNIVEVLKRMVHTDKKQVIATADPRKCAHILGELISQAECVKFLDTFCVYCNNGTLGSFTSSKGTPVCRFHDVPSTFTETDEIGTFI